MRPNLSGFVSYVSAPAARRRDQAQRTRLQSESEYSPATDFWKGMRTAIQWERKTTRDGSALREAALRAVAKKQPSYQLIADVWPAIAQRWAHSSHAKPTVRELRIGGLDIAVRPLFSELMPDGSDEHVMVWMNKARPSDTAVQGALRLLTLLDEESSVRAVFVDTRRRQIFTATAEDLRDIDETLSRTCASFLRDAA